MRWVLRATFGIVCIAQLLPLSVEAQTGTESASVNVLSMYSRTSAIKAAAADAE